MSDEYKSVKEYRNARDVELRLHEDRFAVMYQEVYVPVGDDENDESNMMLVKIVRVISGFEWRGRALTVRIVATYTATEEDDWKPYRALDSSTMKFLFSEPYYPRETDCWMVEHEGSLCIYGGTNQPIELLTRLEAEHRNFPVK